MQKLRWLTRAFIYGFWKFLWSLEMGYPVFLEYHSGILFNAFIRRELICRGVNLIDYEKLS